MTTLSHAKKLIKYYGIASKLYFLNKIKPMPMPGSVLCRQKLENPETALYFLDDLLSKKEIWQETETGNWSCKIELRDQEKSRSFVKKLRIKQGPNDGGSLIASVLKSGIKLGGLPYPCVRDYQNLCSALEAFAFQTRTDKEALQVEPIVYSQEGQKTIVAFLTMPRNLCKHFENAPVAL